jgi:tetratricopeptide (TPR) repeat protein
MILVTQSSRQREAIVVLEQLLASEATADDRFLLAQLYETRHQWTEARDQLLLVVSLDETNPLYLSYFARSLLRHGDVSAARHWLAKLEEIRPQAFATMEIKARLLKAQDQDAEAVAVVDQFVRNKGAGDLRMAAALLDELGQPAAAERIYRKYVSQAGRPESILEYATFLGRQKRLAEALDLCERARQSCPPETLAGVSVALVAQAGVNENVRQRVAGWLEAAIKDHPTTMSLLLSLAELRNLQGRYPEGESLYRQALDRENDNLLALNNLAWLLAKTGRGAEALVLINQAIEAAGPLSQLLDTRAIVYLALNQGGPAVVDLQEAIAQDPNAAQYFHLAQAHWLAKNRSAAVGALRQAQDQRLKVDDLHPLERPAYDQLRSELKPE